MTKIKWRSRYAHWSWGRKCDNCGAEASPEGSNYWFYLRGGAEWDLCSEQCLREVDVRTTPPILPDNYTGGDAAGDPLTYGDKPWT